MEEEMDGHAPKETALRMNTVTWKERLLLAFRKSKYSYDIETDSNRIYFIRYKTLGTKIYILSEGVIR